VEALVDYIYTTLGLDLDYVIPFAAVPENGREIDGLDDKSELAHRIMLVNLLRLLGAIKTKKASRQIVTRPTQVVLPYHPITGCLAMTASTPNLRSPSKHSSIVGLPKAGVNIFASLAPLLGKYVCHHIRDAESELFSWTRGTGLMDQSNMVAQEVESHGVRTFSAKEMAFNILGLMHPILVQYYSSRASLG
jgi:fatty acid synthase subunit alpha